MCVSAVMLDKGSLVHEIRGTYPMCMLLLERKVHNSKKDVEMFYN